MTQLTAAPSSSFKTIRKVRSTYSDNTLTEYESCQTGMRIVVVDQVGPMVTGQFTLATEINDDSGAPHTLEHLCFMGSKAYPYKGVLDQLANRAYSNTNAWTAVDHTAYTLETAGWAGFAQILPIYLDHVVVPTLTDEACYTEVWHVDGEGNDAGVVYSEMQGVQNKMSEIMALKAQRLMYPEGVGFRYETGGMMEQLRVLTADRIREFHREMYQPKNLCLIIAGEVDHQELFDVVSKFEESIMNDIPKPDEPFSRPWVDSRQPTPLTKSVKETVEFPEEDESMGEIVIRVFGPPGTNATASAALSVILTYIAGSSVSVLENTLVEREQICSAVYYSKEPRPSTVVDFTLSSVDSSKLEDVEARFWEVLKGAANSKLDMEYLKDCLSRARRQQKYFAESGGSFFTSAIIIGFLFDKRDGTYLDKLASLEEYNEIAQWTEDEWRAFLKKWLADAAHVTVIGKPSVALSKKLQESEAAGVEARRKELGPEGLGKLKKRLEQANEHNNRPIPKEMLEQFKVPETSSIHFIPTSTAGSGAARGLTTNSNPTQDIIDHDKANNDLFIHFEHINSSFVGLNLFINTEQIPLKLRPLLAIYLDNFFDTPITRDGKHIEFEQVVIELERDTVDYGMTGGGLVGNSEILHISFQVEIGKYSTAIQWVKTMLWDSVFDLDRIAATVAKLLADIPEEKRSGNVMVRSIASMTNYAPESIGRARNTLVKALYLKNVKKQIKENPNAILEELELIRDAITKPTSFRVLVISNVKELEKPVSSWDSFLKTPGHQAPPDRLDRKLDRMSENGRKPGDLCYIVPIPSIDSSFLASYAKGPEDFHDPRIPALMVAISYLDAVEGPMWTAIRGAGLAYGTHFERDTTAGHVSFFVYRSPDSLKAFMTAQKVVEEFVSGKREFDKLALEGAISGIVMSTASSQATAMAAALDSFVKQVIRGLPKDWNDIVLKKVRAVTVDEIKTVMKEVLLPLFKPEDTNVFVTCASIMEQNLGNGLKDLGFAAQTQPLTYFQDSYGLRVEDGGDNDSLDGDEEEEEESGADEEVTEGEGLTNGSADGTGEIPVEFILQSNIAAIKKAAGE